MRVLSIATGAVGILLGSAPGCGEKPKDAPLSDLSPDSNTRRVVLLGDPIRLDALAALARDHSARVVATAREHSTAFTAGGRLLRVSSPTAGADSADTADMLSSADAALLVTAANQGWLAVHREHLILAKQTSIPFGASLIWGVERLAGHPDGVDLLALVEVEVLNMLEEYNLKPTPTRCYRDATLAGAPDGHAVVGSRRIAADIVVSEIASRSALPKAEVREFSASIYIPTKDECPASLPLKNGDRVSLWFTAHRVDGVLRGGVPLVLGDAGRFTIVLERPMSVSSDQRFLIFNGGRIGAIGAVSELAPK